MQLWQSKNQPANTCIWTILTFADEFGEPTNDKYITNDLSIRGSFSNSATENSDLDVQLIISAETHISIILYEYAGTNPVKSGYSDTYKIRVKPAKGEPVDLRADNTGNRLTFNEKDSKILSDLLVLGGKLIFSIIKTDNYSETSYKFTIEDASCYDVTLAELSE